MGGSSITLYLTYKRLGSTQAIWHPRAGCSIMVKSRWNILKYYKYCKYSIFGSSFFHKFKTEWYQVKRFLNEMYSAFAYKEEDVISIIDTDHWLNQWSKRDTYNGSRGTILSPVKWMGYCPYTGYINVYFDLLMLLCNRFSHLDWF